jgi:hypothetical protein
MAFGDAPTGSTVYSPGRKADILLGKFASFRILYVRQRSTRWDCPWRFNGTVSSLRNAPAFRSRSKFQVTLGLGRGMWMKALPGLVGVGISEMRERLRQFGGVLTVHSKRARHAGHG